MLALLNTAMLASTEAMINGLVTLDSATGRKLQTLEGLHLTVKCTTPEYQFHLMVENAAIRLGGYSELNADAVLSGSATALLALLGSSEKMQVMQRKDLAVTGNMEKVQALQDAMAGLQIDWEYYLAKVIGDIPVQSLSTGMEKLADYVDENARNLQADVDNYLHREARLFPEGIEVELFYQRINKLRLRLDRAAARIELLQKEDN